MISKKTAVDFLNSLLSASQKQVDSAKIDLANKHAAQIEDTRNFHAQELAALQTKQQSELDQLRSDQSNEMEQTEAQLQAQVDQIGGILGLLTLLPDDASVA